MKYKLKFFYIFSLFLLLIVVGISQYNTNKALLISTEEAYKVCKKYAQEAAMCSIRLQQKEKELNELYNRCKKLTKELEWYNQAMIRSISVSDKSVQIYKMRITAYTPRKEETDDTPHKTALNTDIVVGRTAAVSRDMLHMLGKYIYIEGYGVWYVSDIMNRRYIKSIDLCLTDNVQEALKFGVKYNIRVIILNANVF